MSNPKKLIEVAIPVKEVSTESVRDKSIRHGHISTLHLWWARRPLPVCRAVVFASLVPDPLDPHCPQAFRDAVELLLGAATNAGDPYGPYADIPWTAIYDPMEDNLRNRLQMFIGKFTDEMQLHLLKHTPKPGAGAQLSSHSLIKWDNKNNEAVINKARKLIWVAFNSIKSGVESRKTADELLTDFDKYYGAVKKAEAILYGIPDRHLETKEVKAATKDLTKATETFLDKMPRVFDPFAGGGAIPLEAARLGCRSYGNDINPVAHIIQKGSLEFPQQWGKPITYSHNEFVELYGRIAWEELSPESRVVNDGKAVAALLPNRLSYDVAHYARKLLAMAEKEIGHYYPADKDGKKPIAYYWVRIGTCNNPSCKAEVPLLKGFYLANTDKKQVHLQPVIKGTNIEFNIINGRCQHEGFVQNRKSLVCPCCSATTTNSELKHQFLNGKRKLRLLAIIVETETGKAYRLPTQTERDVVVDEIQIDIEKPIEKLPIGNTKQFDLCPWGFLTYGEMFSNRQLLAMQTLCSKLEEIKEEVHAYQNGYGKAVITYLAIFINRIAMSNTSFGLWKTSGEFLSSPFSQQAIAMVFDFPESNPFCNSTGSALNQLDWITRYIESECHHPFSSVLQNASSGEKEQFDSKYLDAVVTDPPYYDAIAYADLSDFFYVWFKRTLGNVYPLNFLTPQTPKTEECTALKYHRNNSKEEAKLHFENKLLQIFDAIQHQTSDIVSIMFAHQSTEAWTTLIKVTIPVYTHRDKSVILACCGMAYPLTVVTS